MSDPRSCTTCVDRRRDDDDREWCHTTVPRNPLPRDEGRACPHWRPDHDTPRWAAVRRTATPEGA